MLCVVLTFVFSGMWLSSAIDAIQHAASASTVHEHIVFSDLSIEQHHVDGDDGSTTNEGSTVEHLVGGHHHHGESGSGVILSGPENVMVLIAANSLHGIAQKSQTLGLRIAGPERPPKRPILNG